MSFQNSIRHNLSLHSKFKRIQNEGTGKSSWWVINYEAKPGKSPRRRTTSMDNSAKFSRARSKANAANKKVCVAHLYMRKPLSFTQVLSLTCVFESCNWIYILWRVLFLMHVSGTSNRRNCYIIWKRQLQLLFKHGKFKQFGQVFAVFKVKVIESFPFYINLRASSCHQRVNKEEVLRWICPAVNGGDCKISSFIKSSYS